jgi:hypothetical protein
MTRTEDRGLSFNRERVGLVLVFGVEWKLARVGITGERVRFDRLVFDCVLAVKDGLDVREALV